MLQRLHQLAQMRGGQCLSSDYCKQKQKILWQCNKGHKWLATATSVVHLGSWCPVCAGNRRLSMTELNGIAIQKGGQCLSTEYINSKIKMQWQCQNGHQWYATAFSIKVRKSWCPVCYENSLKKENYVTVFNAKTNNHGNKTSSGSRRDKNGISVPDALRRK